MSFNLSGLAAYTEQERLPLLTKTIAGAKTMKLITPQTGIKSSAALNILDTDAILQGGAACGFSPSGTTSLTQRTITVGPVKVHERLCPKDLQAYWSQIMLKGQGSNPENISFEQAYTDLKAQRIALANETALWYGDTTSGNTNLSQFDGFIKLANNATGIITGNTGSVSHSTGITGGAGGNALTVFTNVYDAIPAALLDKQDVVCFTGWDTFRSLISNITGLNLFHYDADDAAKKGEIVVPGTSLKVIAVNGLNNQNNSWSANDMPIFCARTSNLFYGTDLEGEDEKFDMFYAREAMEVRFVVEYKLGAQFAFPYEIVTFKFN